MQLSRSWKVLSLLLIFFASLACGMSEGQSVNLYLGAVTVHERRLQDDAATLDKTIRGVAQPKQPEELKDLRNKLAVMQTSIEASLKEIEALSVPGEAKEIHTQYLALFNSALTAVKTAQELVAVLPEPGSTPKAADTPKLAMLLAKLQSSRNEITKADAAIKEEQTRLSKRFPEVKIPGASSSENDTHSNVH